MNLMAGTNHQRGIHKFAQAVCLRLQIVQGAQLAHIIGNGHEKTNVEAVVSWLKGHNFDATTCELALSTAMLQKELSDLLELD